MTARAGRRSIFRDKNQRVDALLSMAGYSALEDARFRLSKIAKRPIDAVSDGDVIEFLARGEAETRKYIAALEREAELEREENEGK